MTILTTVVAVVAVSAVLLAIYALATSGKYSVERKLVMACPPQTVYDKIMDLRSQQEWGPWHLHEPECKTVYSGESRSGAPEEGNKGYSWDGKIIGAGRMTVESAKKPRRIDQRLEFIRPFKSVSHVHWVFSPVEKGTEVSWRICGEVPFLFRLMLGRMKRMLAMDFDFGLARLSGLVAPDEPHLRVEIDGEREFPATRCFTAHYSGGMQGMKKAASSLFPKLFKQAGKSGGEISGSGLIAYRKARPAKMLFTIDICLPVSGGDAGEFTVKTIGGGNYLRTTMRGGYRYLQLVWHQAFNHIKMRRYRYDWKRPAIEVYETSPAEGYEPDSNSLVTAIYLPLRK